MAHTHTSNLADTLAYQIVRQWYSDLPGLPEREPTYREVQQSQEMLDRHGEEIVLAAYPVMREAMRRSWPDALRWGAADVYWLAAIRQVYAIRRKAEAEAKQMAQLKDGRRTSDRERAEERTFCQQWQPVWDALPDRERAEIERVVDRDHPFAKNIPVHRLQLCLRELAKRNGK